MRLLFTVILNPAAKFFCLLIGVALSLIGSTIKVSLAKPLDKGNKKIVNISEKIDLKYLTIRQVIFSFLNLLQQKIKLWAYSEEILSEKSPKSPLATISSLEKANQASSSVFSEVLNLCDIDESTEQDSYSQQMPTLKAPRKLGFFKHDIESNRAEPRGLVFA